MIVSATEGATEVVYSGKPPQNLGDTIEHIKKYGVMPAATAECRLGQTLDQARVEDEVTRFEENFKQLLSEPQPCLKPLTACTVTLEYKADLSPESSCE